jgi:hypothetical protein
LLTSIPDREFLPRMPDIIWLPLVELMKSDMVNEDTPGKGAR